MDIRHQRVEYSQRADLNYLLYLPPEYEHSTGRYWPLIVFLHGVGERGSDIRKVTEWGLPRVLEEGRHIDFVAVAPQCPENDRWHYGHTMRLIDELLAVLHIDPQQVILSGFSMGGYAAWQYAADAAERFAALVPIAGGGNPRRASLLRELPVWAFHGALDDVVPLHASQEMVSALQSAGGNVRFTVYPDGGHTVADLPFENDAFYRWLHEQCERNTRRSQELSTL